MRKIILTFGSISGVAIIASILLGGLLAESLKFSQLLGYLFMIVALSVIFVGIKRYRDHELGGVIRFGTAMLVGLGIAAVASVVYVGVWEINLSLTDHAFIEDYTSSVIAGKEADGVEGEELAALVAEMEVMKERYANPLFRVPMTFLEIFPVGLVVALVAAAVLRNSRVLPAEG